MSRRASIAASTSLALVAFAANSLLCRMALRETAIDAATFSIVRFTSGALMLLVITMRIGRGELRASRAEETSRLAGSWAAAAILAVYALPFAFAYTRLSTGTGALILFGCVQVTMLLAALGSGERPGAIQWAGILVALGGLVNLVFPGLTAPSPVGAALMATAGVCWGLYSLRGRGTPNPLSHTTGNFVRAVPLVVAGSLPMLSRAQADARGVTLAVVSGAVTSGLGYVVWFAALRGLSAVRAAVVQLAVPLLAAAAGVVFLSEAVSLRLALSTVLVLGGIAMAIVGGRRES